MKRSLSTDTAVWREAPGKAGAAIRARKQRRSIIIRPSGLQRRSGSAWLIDLHTHLSQAVSPALFFSTTDSFKKRMSACCDELTVAEKGRHPNLRDGDFKGVTGE